MLNNRLVSVIILLVAIACFILTFNHHIDIEVSNLFYEKSIGFLHKDHAIAQLFYHLVTLATTILAVSGIIYLIYFYLKTRSFKLLIRTSVFFLLIAAIITPGLIVHNIFKNNFGRARPSQIVEFGGDKQFTPPFYITNQCNTNCSFSSGHAAMGFYFSIFAYVAKRPYFTIIYLSGLLFGFFVGLSRLMMGGHFISDVAASCLIVLIVNHLLYLLWVKLKSTSTT